jgi:hypothetical protein
VLGANEIAGIPSILFIAILVRLSLEEREEPVTTALAGKLRENNCQNTW